jgi:riboflavin kinase/FMN adenylyltransferase
MRVFRSLQDIPADFPPTVASIGNFDGVHLGHRYILGRLREQAVRAGAKSLAVTFDPHPTRLLRPHSGLRLITPLAQRLALLAETGIDATLVLPFTPELSRLSAADFAAAILRQGLRAIEVHEGDNFRFGHRAEGGVQELTALGHDLGFTTHIYPARHIKGMPASSSRIRSLLAAGDLRRAKWLLGRPFSVVSTPARGRGIGARLTVPTINLAPYPELLPANGVYVTRLAVPAPAGSQSGVASPDGTAPGSPGGGGTQPDPAPRCFDAVTNIGIRPTFADDPSLTVETHLLDYDPVQSPLVLTESTPLELFFLHRLRDEIAFPTPSALKSQIALDITQARRLLRTLP